MRFESRSGKNEEKLKINVFCNLKKHIFLYCSFLAGPLALHIRDDL
jgi:hypothetical protein